MTVNRPQVAVFIGPLIPDGHFVVVEIFNIGIAGDKPQKFVDNGAQVDFLGCEKGESFTQVEAHLIAEYALGAHTGFLVKFLKICLIFGYSVKDSIICCGSISIYLISLSNSFSLFSFLYSKYKYFELYSLN